MPAAKKTTTGKAPVKRAAVKPAAPQSYSIGYAQSDVEDVKLPSLRPDGSHNVCRARRVGVEGLISMGLLDSLDSLTAMVQTAIITPTERGTTPQDELAKVQMASQMAGGVAKSLEVVNRVVQAVVVEPELAMPPVEGERRKPGVFYVDWVDLEDRMFLFQFTIGGTRDLETFRQGSKQSVESLAAGEGLRLPTL